ncbi:hypothetical protein ACGF3C_02170 [Micromonospora sp. NPDC047762]|uniref:hypothetical protein n=1 Tax=Micromonospora sp. NPDC047762 TaxID=3364255 RepID=UPI0037244AAF
MATTLHDQIDIPLDAPTARPARRRTKGDQSLGVLLTVYLALLLAAGVSAAVLAQWMRGAS